MKPERLAQIREFYGPKTIGDTTYINSPVVVELLGALDEAHRELEEMRATRDAACDLAESIYDGGNAHGFVTNYTDPLRAVGAKP